MVAFGEFRIRTLGKAVVYDAVFPVVGTVSHTEGFRESLDLLYADIIGFLKDPGGQTVVESAVQIENLSQGIKAAEKAVKDILLDLLKRGLVRDHGIPGKNQNRIIDTRSDPHVAQFRLVLEVFRIL